MDTHIYSSNEAKENSFLKFFQRSIHIGNEQTYKISNYFMENTFEFHYVITTHQKQFMKKYDLTSCNICLCKGVLNNYLNNTKNWP